MQTRFKAIPILLAACLQGLAQGNDIAADSSIWKAAYLGAGTTFLAKGEALELTLVSYKNWFVASRLSWTDHHAPALPSDYQQPTVSFDYPDGPVTYEDCFLCLDFSNLFSGYGNSSNSTAAPDIGKQVRLWSFSAGWMHQLSKPNLRLRAEGGLALMRLREPVDFVFVPDSVEKPPGTELTITTTHGYTFTRVERKLTGLMLRASVEFPFHQLLGIGTDFTVAIAEGEPMFQLGFNLLFGVVK